MQRRRFSREFKGAAARLIKERDVSVARVPPHLDVHEAVLRKWARELTMDPLQGFTGNGPMEPEQLEIDRLRRDVPKLEAERDIPKRAAASFAREFT